MNLTDRIRKRLISYAKCNRCELTPDDARQIILMSDRVHLLDGLLDDFEEYLAERQDVVDGSYGEPHPNKAMSLLIAFREAGLSPVTNFESPEDADSRAALEESNRVAALFKAVDDEPEVPGEMPQAMWEAINGDRDATAAAIRIAVRQTKAGIRARLRAALANE